MLLYSKMKTIDIHTHGIYGVDTRTRNVDDIIAIARIQGSHGVTEIIPTLYSSPIREMRAQMETVRKAMEFQKRSLPPRTAGVGRGRGEIAVSLHKSSEFISKGLF